MAYTLAGFVASGLASSGRVEANFKHFFCPFSIVVSASARTTEMVLPAMSHFVCKSRKDFQFRLCHKRVWIEGDLSDFTWIMATGKLASGIIPHRKSMSLQVDEAFRKGSFKESGIKELIGFIQFCVACRCRGFF